jgi:hypothetical protein
MQYWAVLFETTRTVWLWRISTMLLCKCNTNLLQTIPKSTATKIITLHNRNYLVGLLSLPRSAHRGGTNNTARILAANHTTAYV